MRRVVLLDVVVTVGILILDKKSIVSTTMVGPEIVLKLDGYLVSDLLIWDFDIQILSFSPSLVSRSSWSNHHIRRFTHLLVLPSNLDDDIGSM